MTDDSPTDAEFEGLRLDAPEVTGPAADRKVLLRGSFRTYVHRGSQLSTWEGFPL